jgi:hypothetical protein
LPPLETRECFGRRNCNVNLDELSWDRPDLDCEPQQARVIPRNLQVDNGKIVRSENQHIVVRSIRRTEPDYEKYAKALIEFVIEQQRKQNPDSVKWYDERHPWLHQDTSA